MKKIFVIIMTTALLLLCASAVSAAGPVELNASYDYFPTYEEELTVTISAEGSFSAKALYLGDFSYDTSLVELVSGQWLIDGAAIQLDLDSGNLEEAAIAFDANTTISGDIFSLTFRSLVDKPVSSYFGYDCDILVKSRGAEIPYDGDIQCGGTNLFFSDKGVSISISAATVNSYEGTVSVDISIDEPAEVKTLSFQPRDSYDGLKLIGGEWLIDGEIKVNWTEKDPMAVMTLRTTSELSGPVFRITYKILDNKDLTADIVLDYCKVTRTAEATGEEYEHDYVVYSGTITVIGSIRGDVNGDGVVTSSDAIYLLRHTLNSIRYPINQSGDMNGDGTVGTADACYLLRHVMLPDRYPLS